MISEAEELAILSLIHGNPQKWVSLSARHLQVYGGTVTPKGLVVQPGHTQSHRDTDESKIGDEMMRSSSTKEDDSIIPQWMNDVISRVTSLGVTYPKYTPGEGEGEKEGEESLAVHVQPEHFEANHVLLNRYSPGQGIMPHLDGSSYSPLVVILSLGSALPIHFWRKTTRGRLTAENAVHTVYLEPRSLFLFSKELYHEFMHGISETSEDTISIASIASIASLPYDSQEIDHNDDKIDEQIDHGYPKPVANASLLSQDFKSILSGKSSISLSRSSPRYSLTIRYVKPVSSTTET